MGLQDEKGYFFIDRDGTHFRYILNFLRTGALLVPEDPLIRKELLIEAEFYQVPPPDSADAWCRGIDDVCVRRFRP